MSQTLEKSKDDDPGYCKNCNNYTFFIHIGRYDTRFFCTACGQRMELIYVSDKEVEAAPPAPAPSNPDDEVPL